MDNNYYNNSNNNNTNSNSNYNNNNSNNNSSNQYSDSFYSYNNQQNHGNQNNTQNDSTASQAGGYGSTQSSIYGGQNNSHGSGYGTTQNNSQSTGYGNAQSNNQSTGYGSTQSNNQSYGYGSTQNNQQSAGYENTKSNQQNTGYGTTQNNQQSTGYGNQNSNYGTYGSNTSYQSYAYGSNPKPEKKKKERKPGGFGKQLAKCAALALVFGLVAGGVMTGVNYASGKIFGTTNASNVQASLTTGDDSTVQPTAISSSYVATDVSDIVDEVMPSIVAITNVSQTEYQSFWGQSKTYESTSCGSGIIVSQDNEYLYVATNNHVVEGANSLTVTFANDDTVSAEIKGTDPSTDLAVVKVALSSIKDDTMSEIKVATLGSSDTLKVGESCIAIGNALGYGQSVTTGVISALNREVSVSDSSSSTNYTAELIQTFWGQSKTYESTSCGSGIIVSQDNEYLYVATNNHVVEGANSLTVTFANDDTVSAEIKGTDPSTDLAVVKVALSSIKDDTMSEIKVATLGSSDTLKVGESCIAIGNALGYGQSVTTGVISALNREVSVSDSSSSTNYTAELIQTDAAINPGNSGGALLNTVGEVIGINSVKYSDTSVEGIGYAIPMDTAKPIIEELITKEKVDESNSAYLGIVGVDVTSDVAKTYNMPTGVYVAQVMEGAAAEQAGIQKGDIITKFDGKDVTSMEELSYNMQYYAAGTTVDVVIERSSNGQYEEQTISVTLGKKN